MKKINIISCIMCLFVMSSCYKDYIQDYEYSTVYFASQKPLRTVIADRDMSIKVGVAIGGKREVSSKDWAEFEIDPSLLKETGLTLLPSEYYTLSDANTFRVSSSSVAVADVTISFTDAFYADQNTTKVHYAIPFRLKNSSLDKVLSGKDYSIVGIKYISNYHGTYYVKGEIKETDENGAVIDTKTYSIKDLSQNITRNVSSLSKRVLVREGIANHAVISTENIKMTMNADHTVTVETADNSLGITNASGHFTETKETIEITLQYHFIKNKKKYEVSETLIRRQDPIKDLRFEEW